MLLARRMSAIIPVDWALLGAIIIMMDFLDLYVSNYNDVNVLYKNNKDGTFSNVGSSAGVDDDSIGVDIAWEIITTMGF